MDLRWAATHADITAARQFFEEYAAALDFSLTFQHFAAELAHLPGNYAAPAGSLLLAFHGDQTAGCVALRSLKDGVCELKRPASWTWNRTGTIPLRVQGIWNSGCALYRLIPIEPTPARRRREASRLPVPGSAASQLDFYTHFSPSRVLVLFSLGIFSAVT